MRKQQLAEFAFLKAHSSISKHLESEPWFYLTSNSCSTDWKLKQSKACCTKKERLCLWITYRIIKPSSEKTSWLQMASLNIDSCTWNAYSWSKAKPGKTMNNLGQIHPFCGKLSLKTPLHLMLDHSCNFYFERGALEMKVWNQFPL